MSSVFAFIIIFFAIFGNSKSDMSSEAQSQNKNSQKDILLSIKNWWTNKMSIQKPIKCLIPDFWDDPEKEHPKFLSIFNRNKIPVFSYPCEKLNDERSIKFQFFGKSINGQLTGPGKLILTGSGISDSSEFCLKVNTVMVLIVIRNIIGTCSLVV